MLRVTLLTDFGTADGYVAALKGVIAAVAPGVLIDDAAHDIPPGDVDAAAWALAGYWRLFPPRTVHVVVVDPGVGTERRALAVLVRDRYLVGPDNGVFSRVLDEEPASAIVAIENPSFQRDVVSATFHGRDIFAPAAAHLARGAIIDELGPAVAEPVRLTLPAPRRDGGRVHGEVVHADRFGNLITNIGAELLPPGARVVVAGRECGVAPTYAAAEPGELVAVVGSRGVLEVSVRDGSAVALLGQGRGAPVVVEG
jgi:S-adenosyl-L-methionine hydrolase (adenosine-forming)